MKAPIALLIFLLAVSSAFSAPRKTVQRAISATGILWVQNIPDNPTDAPAVDQGVCTVENVRKVSGGYLAASAAHCAKIELPDNAHIRFFVSYDTPVLEKTMVVSIFGEPEEGYAFARPKTLYPATVAAVGDPDGSDDVSLFLVKTQAVVPVLKLADSSKVRTGDKVFNVSYPLENPLTRGYFEGYISQSDLQSTDKEFSHHFSVELTGPEGGSSGSAVLNKKGEVIAILVRSNGATTFVAVPSNTLRAQLDKTKT